MVVYLPIDPFFSIDFRGFFHYVVHLIGLPPFLSPWFVTLHLWLTFKPYEDPFSSLCLYMVGERMPSHDVVWNAFVSIMKDARFHILHEYTHVFLPHIFQSTCQWVDIMVLVDGIWALVNIVIADFIQINLVSCPILFCGVVITIAIQAKDGFYHDRYPIE
jgi:hypothetical protein